MNQFTKALVVSPLADGKSWVILDAFKYHVGKKNSKDIINASAGFVTDFASVPRLFWFFIPRWGKYGNAAVIHDWLYWDQSKKSRKEADQILLEGMGILKVNAFHKAIIYYAVRWFGWIAWFRNAAEKENGFNRVIDVSHVNASAEFNRMGVLESAYSHYVKRKRPTQLERNKKAP